MGTAARAWLSRLTPARRVALLACLPAAAVLLALAWIEAAMPGTTSPGMRVATALIGVALAALAGIASRVVGRTLTAPLERLTREVTKVAEGDLSVRLEEGSKEIPLALVRDFNRVLGSLSQMLLADRVDWDVAEHQGRQQQRRATELERLRSIVEAVPYPLLFADGEMRIRWSNPAFQERLGSLAVAAGLDTDELVGQPLGELHAELAARGKAVLEAEGTPQRAWLELGQESLRVEARALRRGDGTDLGALLMFAEPSGGDERPAPEVGERRARNAGRDATCRRQRPDARLGDSASHSGGGAAAQPLGHGEHECGRLGHRGDERDHRRPLEEHPPARRGRGRRRGRRAAQP
jgi:PAS domain-containing protein